jgi:hypothetical protein
VRARIVVDGKPFFTTDRHYPVLTAGKDNEVELQRQWMGYGSTPGKLEVGDVRGGDCPHRLETPQIGDTVEQSIAGTQ